MAMPLTPANYKICPRRRSDYLLPLQFKDSEGDPINLTAWEVHAQVWEKSRNSKLADFEVTVVSPSTGRVNLLLNYEVTEDLPDTGYYDVLLIDGSDFRQYYLEGDVVVDQGYTEAVP